jgi:hypothetical protein
LRNAIKTGQPYKLDHRLLRHDGAYRWFHDDGIPIRDADGCIVNWYVLFTDIHERKAAEEMLGELADCARPLLSLAKARRSFPAEARTASLRDLVTDRLIKRSRAALCGSGSNHELVPAGSQVMDAP